MALGPRLDLRQTQQLAMTPQLQQAIKLLALSNLEIETFIADELERNPLLESRTEDDGDTDAPPDPPPSGDSEAPGADELLSGNDGGSEAQLDIDYESLSDDGPGDGPATGLGVSGESGGGDADIELVGEGEMSLHDHLFAQARASLSGHELLIAEQLLERIDETGYLRADLLRLSHQLGLPLGEIEAVLAEIQSFDPTGVGARSLAECLALQAKEADRYDPCMRKLIERLDLVARGEFTRLKQMCRVDDEELAEMIAELRSYDPKPGCRFGGEPVQTAVPDIIISESKGGWAVELNTATLPRLIVNRSYYLEFGGERSDRKSKAWLDECLTSANWLVRALDQRARTITKVAKELVKRQEGFFRRGVAHLKPLTLRDIAEAIGMHESTVSRATSNKFLSCERGVFELRFFFSSGVGGGEDGEAASSQAVKERIRKLIGQEEKILSDDKLVALLKEEGFDVARRTVAKYRESLGIGSSVERRRQRKLAAKTV
ncbi:MAG: RNA polymerase factor sigma-54 [Parasphingopyxis sp.]|nr:RNA polymerase factor sigma-54 [Sphingomonadales bacterium]